MSCSLTYATRPPELTIPIAYSAGMVLGTEQVGQIAEDDVQTMFDTNVLGLISLTQIFVNGELCL